MKNALCSKTMRRYGVRDRKQYNPTVNNYISLRSCDKKKSNHIDEKHPDQPTASFQ